MTRGIGFVRQYKTKTKQCHFPNCETVFELFPPRRRYCDKHSRLRQRTGGKDWDRVIADAKHKKSVDKNPNLV